MAENNFRADRLEQAIHTYGLEFDENIKWDNEKMIKLLGDYFINLEPEKYSWGARYVQSLNTVMLCEHLKKFAKQMKPIKPLESDDYVAELKCNGMRCLTVYSPETGFEFYTRKESVSNYLNGNITNKYLFIEKGLITEPKDYKNKFNYRFVLDGELLVEGIENEIKTSQVSIEDYIQSIFSSNAERAREFQKDGHRLKLVVFDVLYFEKNPEIPNPYVPKYSYEERELTPDVINWVEQHFAQYLASAGFKSAGRAKLLYQYLYSLKFSNKYDVRRSPFLKRRELRHLLVNMLQQANLPIFEVEGEDTNKIEYLENTLSEGKEGCFHGRTRVNMADGTYKRISNIKTGDVVLSYNEKTKQIEPKKVLKIFNNGLKPVKEWISVSHGILQGTEVADKQNMFQRIVCTKSHKFFNGNGYTPISELLSCYELDYAIDAQLKSALIGWVLSDACIDKQGIIILSQKEDNPWWHYTVDRFKYFTKKGNYRTRISGKGTRIGYFNILKGYSKEIADIYKSEGTIGLIKRLDLIGLAHVIMGDGAKEKRALSIHTESMSKEELEAFKNKLYDLTGIKATEGVDKRVSTYGHYLRICTEDTNKLFSLIGRYIHPAMQYKFSDRKAEYEDLPLPKQKLNKVPLLKRELITYENFKSEKKNISAWDLEVEDNHNYFVENVLVHNCILKNIHAPYVSAMKSSRGHRAAMKVKQSIATMLNSSDLVEDFDVFITGANPPKSNRIKDMIGSLSCSIYIKKDDGSLIEHEIANVTGISHEWKKKLALVNTETGKISLNPEYEGKVIAIDGLALTASKLKFQHAVLKDKKLEFKAKNPSECIWDESVLKDMVITRGE